MAGTVAAQSGDALVLRTGGDVVFERGAEQPAPVRPGMKLVQGDRITTTESEGSIVSLVLSNGSNVTVERGSSLLLEELTQADFRRSPATGRYGSLREEPSTSSTRLRLDHGEVLGEVRGLNRESTFEIATDVGTAGIRGTIYRVQLEKLGASWRMSVTNADGGVRAGSTIFNLPLQEVGIEEVTVIEAAYDSETGELTLSNVESSRLSPGALGELLREVKEISREGEEVPADPEPQTTPEEDPGVISPS